MNTVKLAIAVSVLAFLLGGCDVQSATTTKKSAFILVNDDSGVLSEPERASGLKLLMLAQIKNLRTKRQYAKANFQVISTSYGRPVFVGNVTDLKSSRASDVIDKIESKADHCNRLADSFNAVRTSVRQLEQRGFNDIYVYFFSSLISTSNPCGDEKITLPQLPVPVDFAGTLTSSEAVQAIGFYYVNPYQIRAYQEALISVASQMLGSGKGFAMFDIESTTHELRNGLLGVK